MCGEREVIIRGWVIREMRIKQKKKKREREGGGQGTKSPAECLLRHSQT